LFEFGWEGESVEFQLLTDTEKVADDLLVFLCFKFLLWFEGEQWGKANVEESDRRKVL
jgi:hypothetical protein